MSSSSPPTLLLPLKTSRGSSIHHGTRDGLGRAAVVLGRASFRARSILRLPQVRPIGIRYNGEVRRGTTDVGFQISEARPRKSVVRHGNARAARRGTN